MADIYDPHETDEPARMWETSTFREIHRDNSAGVLAFATRLLGGDADSAADVTQETFVRLWQKRTGYTEQGQLRSYLFRIAYNLSLDLRRSRRRATDLAECVEIAGAGTDIPATVLAASLEDAVRRALDALPEVQRIVFQLSHYDQLSYREIADALGCPIGTVASRKFLAVEALRKALRAWKPNEE